MPYYSNQHGARQTPQCGRTAVPPKAPPKPPVMENNCCQGTPNGKNCFLVVIADLKPQPYDCETYDLDKALCRGTLFPVLDKPFTGRRVC